MEEFEEELELAFNELSLKWKREHGEELQKNIHWYPVLLRLGCNVIGDVGDIDLEEFEDHLEWMIE